jgi:hypothetical protein
LIPNAIALYEGNAEMIAQWCGGRAVVQHDALDHDLTSSAVNVPTKEGVKRAQVGDKVIRDDDGSFRIEKKQE